MVIESFKRSIKAVGYGLGMLALMMAGVGFGLFTVLFFASIHPAMVLIPVVLFVTGVFWTFEYSDMKRKNRNG